MHWTNRCKELEQDEKQLHQSLEPHLQQVLQGKRLLVFQEMLNDLGYPDNALVQDNLQGLSVDWVAAKIWVFPPALKRPAHNLETAKKLAKGVNHGICKQVASPSEDSLSSEVWRQTEEEVERGWTWFDNDCDVEAKLLAKRFGLQHGEKVRLMMSLF